MKVMNEIKAENTGTIVEILVRNGEAVEYGQVLFRLKPA
jgi:biotin carboxyl carrier protein